MKVNYKHPAFAVWHLAEEPVRIIPYGALLKWFDRVTQFGFHLGGGEIAWRDGVIRAEDLKISPRVSWRDKKCVCVLGRDGKAVVFGEAAGMAEFQAGRHGSRQDFISGCIGEDLDTFGNFPVWIFERCGKCFLHPVPAGAEYEKSEKTFGTVDRYAGKCHRASLIFPVTATHQPMRRRSLWKHWRNGSSTSNGTGKRART